MSTFALWKLFHRPGRSTKRSISMLAIIAFAAATAIFLTVLGGVHGFVWRASADHTLPCLFDGQACSAHVNTLSSEQQALATGYVGLAIFACVLLLVPFIALAGSAARLAASREDVRLAGLRLAGATSSQVVKLTACESSVQALIGALIGVLGYFAIMPIIMLLNFQNMHFDFDQLWVGSWTIVAVVVFVAILALVSSLITLKRVTITPLGVMQRVAAPLPAAWRAVVFIVVMVVTVILFRSQILFNGMGIAGAMVFVGGFIVVCFALVNLVGSWVVAVRARAKARKPKDVATMIAMRRILDNPKRAWRNVSGIALAVFVAGITSVVSYLSASANGVQGAAAQDPSLVLVRDLNTGGMLTLAFAAVLAAVSCGIMQAGNVYEQAQQYRLLMLEGTDLKTLNRARRIEVFTPLTIVVVVAAGCSMLLMLPLFASAMFQPATLLSFLGGIVGCFLLVFIGVLASNRVAAKLDISGYRADD